ncbi:MAG: response regulator [Balneolaceae bacterium]
MKIKILLVDDEPTLLESGKMIFEDEGYEVITASDGINAIDILRNHKPHIIITDYRMPRLNGLGLINWIKKNNPDLPVFMITSYLNQSMEKIIRDAGACEFLLKPIDYAELIKKIKTTVG